jgi:tRNA 5-methylaminomethyl-2-thiouridine biosynthesis bifunctional protein
MNCIVIGAGLAGAACAHALAQKGCEVTVLEASATDANTSPSASLPVALIAAHQSAQDIPISQLSRLGLAATTLFAQKHLQAGKDWLPCGVLLREGRLSAQAQWIDSAAWIKPAALLKVWLAHPRVALRGGVAVKRLQLVQSNPIRWQALDKNGALLAQADAIVLANAFDAKALLGAVSNAQAAPTKLPALSLHPVVGQVLYGPWNEAWQAAWSQLFPELAHLRGKTGQPSSDIHSYCAINGNGHFLPAIPWQGAHIWLSGSTYEHDAPEPAITLKGMQANLERLQNLMPLAAPLIAQQRSSGQLQGWAGNRCTTHDRLPVVSAVSPEHTPGLYLCTALGSRGASFAAVCAEHIAALLLNNQNSPLNPALAKAIAMRQIN